LRTHVTKGRAVLRAAGLSPNEVLIARGGCFQLRLPPTTPIDLEEAGAGPTDAKTRWAAGDPEAARLAATASAAVAGRQFLPGARGAWVEQRQREATELRLPSLETFD